MNLPINQVLCGDCIEVMKTFPKESIDMVVTSPPYNIRKDYGNYKDNKTYEEYLVWLDQVWVECFRVLRDGGRIAINVGDTGRNPYYPVHCDIASRMRKSWWLRGIIIWNKQNCLSNTAWGSWQSPVNPSLRGLHEFIIVASKYIPQFRKYKKPSAWTKKDFLKATLEIWNFSPETRLREHPAPFPEELPKRLIKLYSFLNDVVLDPFVGSGTTCVVAQKLSRRWIGIDINPTYVDMTKKRLMKECSQKLSKFLEVSK